MLVLEVVVVVLRLRVVSGGELDINLDVDFNLRLRVRVLTAQPARHQDESPDSHDRDIEERTTHGSTAWSKTTRSRQHITHRGVLSLHVAQGSESAVVTSRTVKAGGCVEEH